LTIASIDLATTVPRRAPSCVVYRLPQNWSDPTDFTFVEEWESDEALNAHLSSAHICAVRLRLPAFLAAEPDLRRYSVVG
jgi:quinol monooxygenase YgiN